MRTGAATRRRTGWPASGRRLETIRAARAALEAEAIDPDDPDDESGPGAFSGMRWQGRPLRGEDGGPPDRAQRNFTDPNSLLKLAKATR